MATTSVTPKPRTTPRPGWVETRRGGVASKTLYNHGHKLIVYRYPRIERSFRSPLLNGDNLHTCGGWQWAWGEDGKEDDWRSKWPLVDGVRQQVGSDWRTVERVIDGLKPVGFAACHVWVLDPSAYGTSRYIRADAARQERLLADGIARAKAAGCSTVRSPVTGSLRLARPGTVGKTFDLAALSADWHAYLEAPGVLHGEEVWEEIDARLRSIASRPLSDYLGRWGLGDTDTPADWAETGLVLGYPVETTAAIVLGMLGTGRYGVR